MRWTLYINLCLHFWFLPEDPFLEVKLLIQGRWHFMAQDKYLQITFLQALANYIATDSLWEYMSNCILTNIEYSYFKSPCQQWIVKNSTALILDFSWYWVSTFSYLHTICISSFYETLDNIFFSFYCHIIFGFPMWLYHFAFPKAMHESSNCLISLLMFAMFFFFFLFFFQYYLEHSKRCVAVSHCGLYLHFLNDYWCRVLFYVFISHRYLWKGVQIVHPFLFGWLFAYCFENLFWIQVLLRRVTCKYFLPVYGMHFRSLNCMVCKAEVFNVGEIWWIMFLFNESYLWSCI